VGWWTGGGEGGYRCGVRVERGNHGVGGELGRQRRGSPFLKGASGEVAEGGAVGVGERD
jgi:hypothetical protein